MKKIFIHIQAIYPALCAAIFFYFLSYTLLRYVILPDQDILASFVFWVGGILVVLFLLDSFQRFRHYCSAVMYLKNNHTDFQKLLDHEKIAWCTREAAKAACRQHSESLYISAVSYYKEQGYYYYHILPENIFCKNSPLFKISYWKAAFFDFRKKDYLEDLS